MMIEFLQTEAWLASSSRMPGVSVLLLFQPQFKPFYVHAHIVRMRGTLHMNSERLGMRGRSVIATIERKRGRVFLEPLAFDVGNIPVGECLGQLVP